MVKNKLKNYRKVNGVEYASNILDWDFTPDLVIWKDGNRLGMKKQKEVVKAHFEELLSRLKDA